MRTRSPSYKYKQVLVRRVTCPVCKAMKYQNCVGKAGQRRSTSHKERWLLAGVLPSAVITINDVM